MPDCPACFGDGGYDVRAMNAMLGEHLTDAELALVGGMDRGDWLTCDECEGTGVVSDERLAELNEESRVVVARFLAIQDMEKLLEQGG